ncbi:hypothetical protein MNBD_BACTEROID03-477 [hydrothermal vent metagenome]|uniref:Uncharacterized protein n=1 Tax=hydrothermal vent metagenome TaxID=652676 RepID=A0A3B0TSK8_9ZZZZ
MKLILSDGGRAKYFEAAAPGDSVIRAIVHATGIDYKKVHDDLFELGKNWGTKRTPRILDIRNNANPRSGVDKMVLKDYLQNVLGFQWHSCSGIGKGISVHLNPSELPKGKLIVSAIKHFTCVIDGMLYDTFDSSLGGTRGIYGYWKKPDQ